VATGPVALEPGDAAFHRVPLLVRLRIECRRAAAGAALVLAVPVMQRYLRALERLDLDAGLPPRCRIFTYHRVVTPVLFTVRAQMGRDALVAPNGVVVGDSFGNGEFLTSGGINTGVIGHAYRVRQYWQDRDHGADPAAAIATLAGSIKRDTGDWLAQSAEQFRQPPAPTPAQGLTPAGARRQAAIEATRRLRRSVDSVAPIDQWSRLTLFVGRLHSYPLPKLTDQPVNATEMPPEMSPAVAVALGLAMKPFTWPSPQEPTPAPGHSAPPDTSGTRHLMVGAPRQPTTT
jgi:hypothetical protein